MPTFRRAFIEGASYFFTVVEFNRLPILTGEACRKMLHAAWLDVCGRFPFRRRRMFVAEHLHCIWTLPEGDADDPLRWREIKRLFTRSYLAEVGPGERRNEARVKKREAAVWQRRYWEHVIRDEEDMRRHVDYIHYNPVKHGLVKRVADWEWSCFHRYVRMGYYEANWGGEAGEAVKGMRCGE